MSKLKFLQKISGNKRYLIDFSNLKNNLFLFQNSNSTKEDIEKIIKSPHMGIPMIFPKKVNLFRYDKKDIFYLEDETILKKIFMTKNYNYRPYKTYTHFGNEFLIKVEVKKKYNNIVNEITRFNKNSIIKIKNLHKKFKNICAFQTRNIPHEGHETIINHLLKKFDHVVVNPVIGPKKIGDVNYGDLELSYRYMINKKFKNKLSYIPIIFNMFYAGPREAIHHSNIRQAIGFKNFIIGRDHAGAFNNYKALEAVNLVSKYKNKLKINIETLMGAYFCRKCNKIRLDFNCKHRDFENISGTEFRKSLEQKKIFKFANYELQKKLHKLKHSLFVR